MLEKPIVHLSNSHSMLHDLLKRNLFPEMGALFAKKWVFLPDLRLKNRLMTEFVSSGARSVVMGLEFVELGSGIQTLFKEASGNALLFPPLDLLSLHLEGLVETPGLAHSLAKEFLCYGKFGGTFLKKWGNHWQKEVWDEVFSHWNYPYELLATKLKKKKLQGEIHLVNFPFLPKLYHLFFGKLARLCPVHYYQFSPCREFWSDQVTDFEKMTLLSKDPQLSLYFNEGNPHLTGLGKVGRETFRVFEEEDFHLEEHYVEPEGERGLATFQKGLLNDSKEKGPPDASILLCPAPHRLREVEILFSELLKTNVKPTDIQIFAPDIAPYAPYIEQVFGAEDSPYDFCILDLPKGPLLQTFIDLLTLNENRFEKGAVFRLFSSPFFSPLSRKEVQTFCHWIDHSGVKWGVDRAHRKFLLPDLIDESDSGTWEEALEELLCHLLYLPKEATDWDLPYLDFSESELLGKGIEVIRSLRKDLDFIRTASLSAAEWGDHLLTLFSRYLSGDEEGFAPIQERLTLLRKIDTIYPFSSIKRYLTSQLKEKRGSHPAKQLEALTFRSLKPGTVQETKVIALLGMDEEAFPRPPQQSSLNLLGKEGDYSPSPPDEDRYLFLEILSAAKEALIMTYQNTAEEDGKELSPSLLVQELSPQVITSPPFPFHHSYFQKEGSPYLSRHFETAKQFYAPQKSAPFIPEFLHPVPLPPPPIAQKPPTLEDLIRFAKNPLRFYCNKTLNLYLHYDDQTDKEFLLSPLQKYRLMGERGEIIKADQKGHLPLGRFKDVALKKISKEWEDIDLAGREEGHPFYTSAKLSDLIKIYPHYLSLCVEKNLPLVALKSKAVLTLKSDPQKALEDYIDYFQLASIAPSPLASQLADALLKKDEKTLQIHIKRLTLDPYLSLVFSDPSHYDSHVIFETWSPFLRKVFKPLLEMLS